MKEEYRIVSERQEVDGEIKYYRKYDEEKLFPIITGSHEEELIMASHQSLMIDNREIKRLETSVEEFS